MATADAFALDRASVREIDQDGHLHIAESPISKATVNPYRGSEIPDYDTLGLDPNRVYMLLRDPAELEKAAASFEGKPLLNLHRPQTAEDHDKGLTVGSVNSVRWEAPYLMAALHVWDGDAIDGINSNEQRQLSSAYRYRPDMTPGTFEGQKFDGVMRDIAGNHVALVNKGRAGADVVVGDSAILLNKEETAMAAKRILSPRAAVAKDILTKHLKAKMAKDADLGSLVGLLDSLEGAPAGAPADPAATAIDADAGGQIRQLLQGLVSPEVLEKVVSLAAPAPADPVAPAPPVPPTKDAAPAQPGVAGPPPALAKPDQNSPPAVDGESDEGVSAEADGEGDKDNVVKGALDTVSKTAMDAAIASAVKAATAGTIARLNAIAEAKEAVRPLIGSIPVAMDSAAAVFKLALDHFKSEGHSVDLDGVPEAAYGAVFRSLAPMVQASASRPAPKASTLASDSAAVAGFKSRFPNARLARAI
jgi:hypothetical protein